MPNTLAHLGIQGLATRSIIHHADIKWVFLGAILPDIPWIVRRMVHFFVTGVDPISLRLYAIAQASLFLTLILAAAIALLSQRPRIVFFILGLNAFLHLVLDSLQTKWGNGVHLLAPISWNTLNFELFWPDSWITYLLSIFSLVYIILVLFKKHWEEIQSIRFIQFKKIAGIFGLLTCYVVLPYVFMPQIIKADAHSIAKIKNPCDNCLVAFDRAHYIVDNQHSLKTWAREYNIKKEHINHSAIVSIKCYFCDKETIIINDFYEHKGLNRDILSYFGLLIVFFIWSKKLFKKYIFIIQNKILKKILQ
jgi:hypothetical protein